MVFFLQIQLLDKTFRRTLTKPTLDHLARNNMVREVDHYNDVKYVPSTTNNPFTEEQRYRMIKKKHCSLVFSSHIRFNKREVRGVCQCIPIMSVGIAHFRLSISLQWPLIVLKHIS